jgi:hypothetical protein
MIVTAKQPQGQTNFSGGALYKDSSEDNRLIRETHYSYNKAPHIESTSSDLCPTRMKCSMETGMQANPQHMQRTCAHKNAALSASDKGEALKQKGSRWNSLARHRHLLQAKRESGANITQPLK